jgi:hypothetical protein
LYLSANNKSHTSRVVLLTERTMLTRTTAVCLYKKLLSYVNKTTESKQFETIPLTQSAVKLRSNIWKCIYNFNTVISWHVTLCSLQGVYQVSKQYTDSIFRTEVKMKAVYTSETKDTSYFAIWLHDV